MRLLYRLLTATICFVSSVRAEDVIVARSLEQSTSSSPFGVTFSGEASSHVLEAIPWLARVGVRTMRFFDDWGRVEASRGVYDFRRADAWVAAAEQHQLSLTALLVYSPLWTLPGGAGDRRVLPVEHLAAWTKYVRTAVSRYRGRVRDWEVWNEPNAPAFNRGGHGAFEYARVVAASYRAAKEADKAARVGITVANYDLRYLRQVIESLAQQGHGGAFDFIAVHPYEMLARLLENDGEILFLDVVGNLRRMLAEVAPDRSHVPVFFTELGAKIGQEKKGRPVTDGVVADLLVKAYVLGIAQGVEQIHWFEARDAGGSSGFGLQDGTGRIRPSYHAYRVLAEALGSRPKVVGWMPLGKHGTGFGFVFEAASELVLVAWAPPGVRLPVDLPAGAQALDPHTGGTLPLPSGRSLVLTAKPVVVKKLPASWQGLARVHRDKAWSWGSRPVSSTLARIRLGERNVEQGIVQDREATTRSYKFRDGSEGKLLNVGRGDSIFFSLSPHFADYNTGEVYVRVTARTLGANPPGRYTGMNLWYQCRTGDARTKPSYSYRNAQRWWTIPDDGQWHRHVWHVKDAMFVHTFGYDIYLRSDASLPFAVGMVEVSKQAFPEE